jgi:hypothetical protein
MSVAMYLNDLEETLILNGFKAVDIGSLNCFHFTSVLLIFSDPSGSLMPALLSVEN